MVNVKTSLASSLMQIRDWRSQPKNLIAILLSVGLMIPLVQSYAEFTDMLGSSAHAVDIFVIAGSTISMFTRTLLGWLVLISDAPFITPRSSYEIMRMGRKSWIISRIFYMILSCWIYLILNILVCIVLLRTKIPLTFNSQWSQPMYMLAEKQPEFAVQSFSLLFPYPEFIHRWGPWQAEAVTFLCNSLYMLLLGSIVFVVNIRTHKNLGWVIASGFHMVGYTIYMNHYSLPGMQFHPLSVALPASEIQQGHDCTGIILLVAILIIIWFWTVRAKSSINHFQRG